LLGQQDWQRLAELMPALRKSQRNTEDLRSLQKRAALARLGASGVTDEGRAIIYKKLDDDTRRDPEVAVAYCNALSEETEAEAAIRAIVNKTWIPELVVRYGGLGRNTLARRIKTAEAWQKQHQDDAALQLCLGELYEANGEKDKARTAYQRSVDLKDSSEASSNLGRMLAFEGDYKTSNEYLTRALKLGRGS